MSNSSDVVVVGGGVIGLSAAWRCRQRGLSVVVVDPQPGRGASHTAAGMLAPVSELTYNEERLFGLNLASAALYPAFVMELEETTGCRVGYRRSGTLEVAWDSADLGHLKDLQALQRTLGVTSELISGRELRQQEPLLSSGLPGGLFVADDHHIDNRALVRALRAACTTAGVQFVAERVTDLAYANGNTAGAVGAVTGVVTESGSLLSCGVTVLAAGAASGTLPGLFGSATVPVRPVKGQTLRLHNPGGPLLTHVVRGTVKGSPVYIVSRDNGEVIVGASSEEQGFDVEPRAGVVYELMRDAVALVPQLAECAWREVSTNLRPGTPDNAPIIGHADRDGLVVATGHYRNGILLTPITAAAVADFVVGMEPPAAVTAFNSHRFGTSQVVG